MEKKLVLKSKIINHKSKMAFTPLEKVHPVRDLSLTGQADEVGGEKNIDTGGGLMPPPAETVRERSSLTGFTI